MATRVEILCAMWIQLASTCVRTALNVIRRKTRPLKLRASEISIPKTRRFERRRKLTEIRRLIIRSMLDFLTSPTTLLLGANKLGSGLRFLRSWDLIVRGYSVCAPGAATIENRKNRRPDPDLRADLLEAVQMPFTEVTGLPNSKSTDRRCAASRTSGSLSSARAL